MYEPTGGQLELLSRSQLDKIHGATVQVLDRLGVKVWESTAFKMFKDAGAETDPKTMMVKVSEDLLKEHTPDPMDETVESDIERFVKKLTKAHNR